MGKKKAAADSTDESRSTKNTSTTTSGFAGKARNNGIFPPLNSKPPTDLEDIRKRLAQPRATASPPESVYRGYVNNIGKAGNEAAMVVEVSRKLLKESNKAGYHQGFNRLFTNVPPNTGYNNGLSALQPDFVEGLEIEEYRPFPVADHVPGAAIYKDDPYSQALPHLAGEWKGPDGNMREAELQSAYDGAAMVYAWGQALDTIGKPYLAGHAKVMTFSTDGTNFNHFAHYAAPTEDGTLEYHQYPIELTNLTSSYQGFKEGRKQLRNAQDLAREESCRLRDELKDYWRARKLQLVPLSIDDDYKVVESHPIVTKEAYLPAPDLQPPTVTGTYEEVVLGEEPALYEDEADEDNYEIVEPCQPTPAASTESRKASQAEGHTASRTT